MSDVRSSDKQEPPEDDTGCTRCDAALVFLGEKDLHEGGSFFLPDLFESRQRLDVGVFGVRARRVLHAVASALDLAAVAGLASQVDNRDAGRGRDEPLGPSSSLGGSVAVYGSQPSASSRSSLNVPASAVRYSHLLAMAGS